MRKRVALGLLATTVAAWLVPAPALAAGRVLRAYEGTTSSGGTITLFTTNRDGVIRFQGVGLEGEATCADGTSLAFGHGFDLFPRGPLVVAGALDVEHAGFADAFFVSGSLGSNGGTGTLTHLFAALDTAEEPQVCTTGELTWTVERVPALGAGTAGTGRVQGVLATPAERPRPPGWPGPACRRGPPRPLPVCAFAATRGGPRAASPCSS